MRAIGKLPGEEPRIIHIPNTLKAFQEFVGGFIETVTIATDAIIICNEEGRLNDMPYNCSIAGYEFVGPILIVGSRRGMFCGIREEVANICMNRLFECEEKP